METIIIEDPEQCRQVWEKYWHVSQLFDLWQVRECFHDAFARPLSFHLVRHQGRVTGFLPLSLNEETGDYVFFPGETWKGRTWLEQNRIIAETPQAFAALAESVQAPLYLRYLCWHPMLDHMAGAQADETGYLFYPRMYDFSMDNFWLSFPGKSRKKLKAELKKFENITFRFNQLSDLTDMFRMNMTAFRSESYFSDARFYRSFERLAAFLWDMGMLRITTALVDGKVAAIDMGAVFGNTYTVVAGGIHPEFPGIAKQINLHHLEWACRQRFESLDFLCGDFNWKQRFRLNPRPLYELRMDASAHGVDQSRYEKQAACA